MKRACQVQLTSETQKENRRGPQIRNTQSEGRLVGQREVSVVAHKAFVSSCFSFLFQLHCKFIVEISEIQIREENKHQL